MCVCESGLISRPNVFPGQIVGSGSGAGRGPVQASVCCDGADQTDESQRGAAETDGHSDAYAQAESQATPGCASNAIKSLREGMRVALCSCVC